MPIYEYKCPECNHITETFEKLPQPKATGICEKCGQPAVFIPSLLADDHTGKRFGDTPKKVIDYGERPVRRGKIVKTI